MGNNLLQIFENDEFGNIRIVTIDNEPWFVGKDVATALGYKNTKDAIISHIDKEDRHIIQRSEIATIENHIPKEVFPVNFVSAEIPSRGLTAINESGVYALIFGSKLPNAKKFKHWVTSEVLPSIRKTGGYNSNSRGIIVQYENNSLLPTAKSTWFKEHNKDMSIICEKMSIDRKSLYHMILSRISNQLDWKQAMSIYTVERGYPPTYAMDLVEYFVQMQEIANEYLDELMIQLESVDIYKSI